MALSSNNNSDAWRSYSALDVYPTNPCVDAQSPNGVKYQQKGQLGNIMNGDFMEYVRLLRHISVILTENKWHLRDVFLLLSMGEMTQNSQDNANNF